MPVVCERDVSSLPVLSYEGRIVYRNESIERFCKKCGKKFYRDTRDRYFENFDRYGIKLKDSKVVLPYCADCYLETLLSIRSITEFF